MHPDSGQSGGFFHKVMRMVRGSASAATQHVPDPDSLSAREILQETALRKRRNDAIRQQEFAQLRLLRQRRSSGDGLPLHGQNPDEGLASDFGHITRSSETLLKIDAIEAQMSGQWWRQPAGAGQTAATNPQRGAIPALRDDVPALHDLMEPGGADVAASTALSAVISASSTLSPPALPVFVPHPPLEEAAILFAHGDLESARARLLEQLQASLPSSDQDAQRLSVLWHAALDSCRATGDEAAFETLAIGYAQHSGRSAAPWFSMPARLGWQALSDAPLPTARHGFQWESPGVLTAGAVTALRTAQAHAAQPWRMSWQRLTRIENAALQPLADTFNAWADSAGQFAISDAAPLLDAVAAHTLLGNHQGSSAWWLLRMALLRLMGLQDDYEQVALDYCMTYEVSPPQWQAPTALCVVEANGAADISVLSHGSAELVGDGSAQASSAAAVMPDGYSLAGVLEGDVQPWLDAITDRAERGQLLLVRCDNLIRVDFVAAGSVLNWASEMQGQGFVVRFSDVHVLVAAFFHTIGIDAHAAVHTTRA